MPWLIWTPHALTDVQRLHRFLLSKDADAAKRAVAAIRAGIKSLAQQPHIGRPVEDMDAEYREKPVPFGNSGYVASIASVARKSRSSPSATKGEAGHP